MKVAWFHSHIQNWAGGTKFLFELLRRLNRTTPVTLFVEAASPEIRRMFEDENVRVVVLTRTASSKSKLYWIFFPWILAATVRRVGRIAEPYDAYVSSMFPMNYVLMKAGKKPHLCFCFEPFAFFHDRAMVDGFRGIDRLALIILARLHIAKDVEATRSADRVLVIHGGIGEWVKKIYGRTAVSTYLGVNTDVFRRTEDAGLRQKFAGRKIIIHSTDYTPLKRTWFLIKAMPAIAAEAPDALLLITHSQEHPAEQRAMERFIRANGLENHVRILGFVDYDDLPKYYSLAEAAVYPGIGSGASACSLFVLECMACETPCVRTNTSTEETADGESGYLFSPEDEAGMRNAVLKLLTDKAEVRRMGANARRAILARYSWEAVLRVFAETFSKQPAGSRP